MKIASPSALDWAHPVVREWLTVRQREIDIDRMLSSTAKEVSDFSKERGASFFSDTLRGIHKLKDEVEAALWELVAAGLITADGFDNLRVDRSKTPRPQ